MKDLITCIVMTMVDNPEEDVTVIKGARSSVIEIKIANEDIGKIIGKHVCRLWKLAPFSVLPP